MTTTPVKHSSYPAFVSPQSGRIKFKLTPGGANKENVIYQIHDTSTDESYVGKTSQAFKKRVQQHQSGINTLKERGRTRMYDAIRAHPENFMARILAEVSPESINNEEERYIKELDALEKGFNRNKGRGGGSSAKKDNQPFTPPALPPTPEKYFPLTTRANGTIGVKFTPRTARAKKVVYVLKNKETDERYVGKTERELRKRVSEHLHFANHPEKEAGQKPLYQDIRDKTDQFAVGILQKIDFNTSLDEAEKHCIRVKRARTTGYNRNSGGGGSS